VVIDLRYVITMSLNLRIILSATLVLITFITLTAVTLDRAFKKSTESALRDKLTSQLYALMSAAEVDDEGLTMPSTELDALLGLPSSGVYAFVTDQTGETLWQSSSVLGAKPPKPMTLSSGKKSFNKFSIEDHSYYTFAYGVDWSTEENATSLTFNIATDLKSFNKQITRYRRSLWGWLVAMAIFLLVSQMVILRWGLSPLREVAIELNNIESGEQEKIKNSYPKEIEGLTSNINILLEQERAQKTRYRNALGDLAHSLKTPLAVLQSGINNDTTKKDNAAQEQITRMNAIVEYQLQRAATSGPTAIGKSVDVKLLINRIVESLQKVYREKNIKTSLSIDSVLVFKGDEGDLMEMLGNLLDNAFKWADKNIEINATRVENGICIVINDDGPGIDKEKIELLLQRGVRADQTTPGHGIGLSIVQNIVQAYNGTLAIKQSALGGSQVSITL